MGRYVDAVSLLVLAGGWVPYFSLGGERSEEFAVNSVRKLRRPHIGRMEVRAVESQGSVTMPDLVRGWTGLARRARCTMSLEGIIR